MNFSAPPSVSFLRSRVLLLLAALLLVLPLVVTLGGSAAASSPDDGRRTAGASVGTAEGYAAGVTGGAGGDTYWVTTLADSGPGSLRAGLARSGPTWIRFKVSGKITLRSPLTVRSDTTIDGRGQHVRLGVDTDINGLELGNVDNIIIHNLHFVGGAATRNTDGQPRNSGITILGADRVWIDHNTMTGWGDKQIDMPVVGRATVSYNHIKDAAPGHAILIGTKSTADRQGNTRVTIHHNVFTNIPDRSPRIGDGGRAHVYNNYVTNWTFYGMKAVRDAQLFAENNIFDNGGSRKAIAATEGGRAPGLVRADGNLLLDDSRIEERNRGSVSTPNYRYTAERATTDLRDHLLATAGHTDDNQAGSGGSGGSTAGSSDTRFRDVPRGHLFHDDIERLARSGITAGCGSRRFCPDDTVTRGQFAAFLDRALGLPDGPNRFRDAQGHLFEQNIAALARAGITAGCGPQRFCPDDPVTRGQAAAFLTRAGLTD